MATKQETVEIKIEVEGEKQASKALKNLSGSTESMTGSFVKAGIILDGLRGSIRLATDVIQGAARATLDLAKDSIKEFQDYEQQMKSFEILVPRFGVNIDDARESAEKLGKEFRIGVGPAAEGLENLFKAGLNLEEATTLMGRFANEAAGGKNATISQADAMKNLSLAYLRYNSQIGDASGLAENWSDIIKTGEDSLIKQGVATGDITKRMAQWEGIMITTNNTLGTFEALSDSTRAKVEALEVRFTEIKRLIGGPLDTVLNDLITHMTNMGIIDDVEVSVGNLMGKLEELWSVNKTKVLSSIDNIVEAIKEWWRQNREGLIKSIEDLITKLGEIDWENLIQKVIDSALEIGKAAVEIGIMVAKIALFVAQHPEILIILATLKGFFALVSIFNAVSTAIGITKATGMTGAMGGLGTAVSGFLLGPGAALVAFGGTMAAVWWLTKDSVGEATLSIEESTQVIEDSLSTVNEETGELKSGFDRLNESIGMSTLEVIKTRDEFDKAGTSSSLLADGINRIDASPLKRVQEEAEKTASRVGDISWQIGRAMSNLRIFADTGRFPSFSMPRFADGGVAPGGMAMVGEKGPELVNLPRGSRVFSNRESKQMANQTNNNQKNVNVNIGSVGGGNRGMAQNTDILSQLLLNTI